MNNTGSCRYLDRLLTKREERSLGNRCGLNHYECATGQGMLKQMTTDLPIFCSQRPPQENIPNQPSIRAQAIPQAVDVGRAQISHWQQLKGPIWDSKKKWIASAAACYLGLSENVGLMFPMK